MSYIRVIIFALLLIGCDNQLSSKKKVLRLAHTLPENHVVHKAMLHMAETIALKSEGKMELKIFAGGQLGKESDTVALVQLGGIDMTKVSAAAMENFVEEIGIFTLPYVFKNSEHYWGFLESESGSDLLQAGKRVGLRGLTYYDAGARSFYTLDKMVTSPDDLEGMKIRVMGSRNCQDAINALGAQAQSIPYGELYSALQQRVVVGGENNPPSFVTSRHYEVCKFYSLNEHSRIPDMLVMSQVNWEKLTVEEQEIVQQAADESRELQRKLWQEETTRALEQVKKYGVTVLYPQKEPFSENCKELLSQVKNPIIKNHLKKIKVMESSHVK
ncbi:TRAP transporter substrate-binding protein [Lentisphaera profundi]|uniref:TRAP transporter substrate-binding protein n=1 Tax=Lentisphaera profundi TaxID=1658616 RepID=A0ABY7VND3_9BACT|nr:TRAP transporter substrate-binding protein [Lentisphaera profundi]WDE95616.1 TRAP transporter substrate-binding protein [Lentisphaera profundi]